MGRSVLLLRLEGPLQAWGGRSRWDVRDTRPEPTKSGVVGLLGAAFGYPGGDPRLEDLDRGLRFGVRVEQGGTIAEDYHTITDYLPTAGGDFKFSGVHTQKVLAKLQANPDCEPSTIQSPRFYLEDGAFLVALEETGVVPGLLAKCEAALRDPVWPPFLGRKSCVPGRPLLSDGGCTDVYAGIEDALTRHPWSWLGAAGCLRDTVEETLPAFVEDPAGPISRPDALRVNEAREYGDVRLRPFEVPRPPAIEGGAP